MLIALSSSALVSPNFYVNPVNNVNYPVVVRVPLGDIEAVLRPALAFVHEHLGESA